MLNKITRCKLALVLYLPERQSSQQSVLRQITNYINYIDVCNVTGQTWTIHIESHNKLFL